MRDYLSKDSGLSGNRAGIVHRLDRLTSGVMVCAKNSSALVWLQRQFSQRKVTKIYYAVVGGTVTPSEAIIDMPIGRSPNHTKVFRAISTGKPAITRYRVIKSSKNESLLELKPETGRTHQLRVHMAQIGHPIIGDELYGGEHADRLYLHAHSLAIAVKKGEKKTFTAPLPKDFTKFMEAKA